MRRITAFTCSGLVLLGACGGGDAFAPLHGSARVDAGAPAIASPDASARDTCGLPASAAVCDCAELPFAEPPPTLWFVLDRSSSMATDGKWSTLRDAVLAVALQLGPRIQVAASPYPRGNSEECTPGRIAMSPLPGDRPAGTQGATYGVLHDVLYSNEPGGGTPMAATLGVVQKAIAARHDAGRSYVVLTTDGAPNCDGGITCAAATCVPNIEATAGCPAGGPPNCCDEAEIGPLDCLDDAAAEGAVRALAAQGTSTYILGAPGSEPYRELLSRMAAAGGSEHYFPVAGSGREAFTEALSRLAAKILASCTIVLEKAPTDATLVNVLLDGAPLAAGPDWSLATDLVTLHGDACASVLAGTALDVRVVVGCPTVEVH